MKETNPGTVAKPTKTSCLLGKLIPCVMRGAGADDLVMINSRPMLCSRPRHASMKNNLGFPTKEGTSHIWQSDGSVNMKRETYFSSRDDLSDKGFNVPGLGAVLVLEKVVCCAMAAHFVRSFLCQLLLQKLTGQDYLLKKILVIFSKQLLAIPHICHFLYTTAFVRPVKSPPKSA